MSFDKRIEQPLAAEPVRLLRRFEVEALTGLTRSSIYAMMTHGNFPRPVRIGKRAVAWRTDAVMAWIANRKRA